MNKLFTRVASAIICAAMLAVMMSSCADNENDKPTVVDPKQTEETPSDEPVFEEADYEGKTFTILSPMDDAPDFGDIYIDNEEHNGEPINDAVVDRNSMVEEKYKVDIVQRDEGTAQASIASKAGTVDFELVYDWGIRLVPHAVEGIYYDFLQMPCIDLSQDYWAPSAHDDLTIGGKMLITTNDISMNRIGYASFIAFNKNIFDQMQIEYPYGFVERNEWTVDKYYEILTQCGQDNGDQIWDTEDRYGGSIDVGSIARWGGVTIDLYTKNEDGTYHLNGVPEKLIQIYNKYEKSFATNPSICHLGWPDWIEGRDISMYDSQFQAGRVISFAEDHLAMTGTSMSYIPEFSSMQSQFGVVPNPKLESSQAEYYHFIDGCAPMFCVPKQAADMDMVGIILEYMTYCSRQTLLPAYYEQTIKTKNMDDDRDNVMLDIVRDSVHYSWTGLYYQALKNDKGDGWDPMGTILSDMLAGGQFASVYKRYSAAAEKSMNDLYDQILELDVNK